MNPPNSSRTPRVIINVHGDIAERARIYDRLTPAERTGILERLNFFESALKRMDVAQRVDILNRLTPAEREERVDFCLGRVHLENVGQLYPSEISGGMKKRVAIARAIANNPKYLFCDEPNSGLDPRTALVIDELIEEITDEYKMTTIVNTHDMNSVMGKGNKIIFIYKGRKRWEGTVDELLKSDNQELNDFVFASRVMQGLKGV